MTGLRDALVRMLEWHEDEVTEANALLRHRTGAWEFDGEQLVAAAQDGVLRVWLSPARRMVYVQLRHADHYSIELRSRLPAAIRQEIAP